MSIISLSQYRMLFVWCMSKHFKAMIALPYVHPMKMNSRVISVSQLVRKGPKLSNNKDNAASKNSLFPLVNNYSDLAFLIEVKER